MRSALRVPYSAPQMASASALINVCTNAVSIDRNRSGSACCSCSSTAGTSIGLTLAVIVVISPSGELGGSTKDHCGDRFHQLRHTDQRQAVHHVPGLLSGSAWGHPRTGRNRGATEGRRIGLARNYPPPTPKSLTQSMHPEGLGGDRAANRSATTSEQPPLPLDRALQQCPSPQRTRR